MTKPSPEDGSRLNSWNVVWKNTFGNGFRPTNLCYKSNTIVTNLSSFMHNDVLHAVSIPVYKMHCWKEDSCSPNLDRDFAQPCVASVLFCKISPCPMFRHSPYNHQKPWKTLIGTAQRGLWSWSLFGVVASGLWAQQLQLFQLKVSTIR